MPCVIPFVMAGLVPASNLGTPLRNKALTPVGDEDQAAVGMRDERRERFGELDMPLTRLLAINLAIGAVLAVLLVGGLLVLNPGGLRDLIFADRSPLVPIGLLLGGFIVTLGSTAMGTAIMAMGVGEPDNEPRGGWRVVAEKARRKS